MEKKTAAWDETLNTAIELQMQCNQRNKWST